MESEADKARDERLGVSDVIRSGYRDLWAALVECVRNEIKEFSKSVPRARHLACSSPDEDSFTISTSVQPLITLRIILSPESHVVAYRTEIPSPFSAGLSAVSPKFKFAVDREWKICFTDDESTALHPVQVAARLLEPVGRFFEPKTVR